MGSKGQDFCAAHFIWDDHCGFEMTPDVYSGDVFRGQFTYFPRVNTAFRIPGTVYLFPTG